MSSVINTNVKAQYAQNALSVNNRNMAISMQQLSTGKRINSAKDDAAGLAIASRMTADLKGMTMAIKNANDGISMMQTAEGALGEVTNMLLRMRELSVQSSTGSLTASNRVALQKELDQLIKEIDNVSKTSNFNGIKLLDGTAKGVAIQTGVKEKDQIAVTIDAASSKVLGLQGFKVEGQLTSGRVGAGAAIDASDVLINGKNAFSANLTAPTSDIASALASAINTNVGEHRVTATAFNVLKGSAPTTSVFAAGDLTINTASVGAASNIEELVSNINRDVAGVVAVLGNDGTIELSNTTGKGIIIGGTAANAAKAGFVGGGVTYNGYLTLNSMDGNDIKIFAKNAANGYGSSAAGTVGDVKAMGFNESSDGQSFSGGAVDTNAISLTTDLRINGVLVGKSDNSSALSKAAAINKISGTTGVTASAKTEVKVTTAVASIAGASGVLINGKTLDFSAQTQISGVVSVINAGNVNGVTASTDVDGNLLLTSQGGADITVEDASGFITDIASTYEPSATAIGAVTTATAGATAGGETIKGRITLSSASGAEIRVESQSAVAADRTAALALIGMSSQGGSSTMVGGELSIRTQEAAGRAITAIDKAIDNVALSRANLGAFQNRLTASVDNLNTTSTNLSESRSRIADADYASVTTELARQQIIQQAATAMLAQANQQPQTVLALLQ
ncbi:MAG: flagellin protein FlaA [Betaproteobacteria bacterium]|nr:flagellin protein FlaA [Betaproteobacteria bacterium]